MDSGINHSRILKNLIVGSCPVLRKDVRILEEEGVTAVLNLQTDDDFVYWGIDWEGLKRTYDESRILALRYPIRDFDVAHLRVRLQGGVDLLDEMLKNHTVYLHCSAGINRSPTVAIAFIMMDTGMDLEEAVSHFRKRHYCEPYTEALR
jgi:protein-tyrosine phosphatase